MTLCPVCNAQLEDLKECHRCKTYLGQIMDIKNQAMYHQQKAIAAFEQSHFHEMFFHARRSLTLFYSPESARLLASASILINKFDLGYMLWNRVKTSQLNNPEYK
ncbi:MAG: hypothetical protein HQK72_11335 [Desulfamplus sp.]|nr:hypothetical protein [Desulfamplus sp.]